MLHVHPAFRHFWHRVEEGHHMYDQQLDSDLLNAILLAHAVAAQAHSGHM